MRVLHDGPLHYTSVDVLATDLSYLAITQQGQAQGGRTVFTFTFSFIVESEKAESLRDISLLTFNQRVFPRLIYGCRAVCIMDNNHPLKQDSVDMRDTCTLNTRRRPMGKTSTTLYAHPSGELPSRFAAVGGNPCTDQAASGAPLVSRDRCKD